MILYNSFLISTSGDYITDYTKDVLSPKQKHAKHAGSSRRILIVDDITMRLFYPAFLAIIVYTMGGSLSGFS